MRFLRYLKKFIGSLVLLILVVAAVTFAVSNRAMVTVNLWPLEIEPSMQLGATVLAAFAIGLIAGTGIMAASRLKIPITPCDERSESTIERGLGTASSHRR